MTDVAYHRSRYDVPKAKGFMGVSYPVLIVCLLVVSILFALLISVFILKETASIWRYVAGAVIACGVLVLKLA